MKANNLRVILDFPFSHTFLRWDPPEADHETKIWVQVVYWEVFPESSSRETEKGRMPLQGSLVDRLPL